MKTWILILVMAIVTFSTRAFPFIVWGKNHNVSPLIEYLGKALPFAMMGLLVVYSFKNVSFTTSPFGLPELIASFVCIGLHLWKRNNMLSILGSTLVYMFLIQVVI